MYGLTSANLQYLTGINTFITAAKAYARDGHHVFYPCRDCKNLRKFVNVEQIRCHLITRGFVRYYTLWSKHGEVGENVPQETFDDVIIPDVAPPQGCY